jgi:hypothetical protein
MKSDLDEALKPIRDADAVQLETEIEALLQIGPDGKFALREDLEGVLAGIQAKFDELLATLQEHHPRKYLEQIDQELTALASRIQEISPQLTLEPVTAAIAQIKGALGSFDLEAELEPVQSVFDQAIAKLDEFSPAQLLEPLGQRVTVARQKVEELTRINEWSPALDDLAAQALSGLDVLNEERLSGALRTGLEQLREEVSRLPGLGVGSWLGAIVAGLMRGSPLRIAPSSIDSVMRWTAGEASGSAELTARATRIAEALRQTRAEVNAFDPLSLSAVITGSVSLRSAVEGLSARLAAGSGQRLRLEASASRLDAGGVLGRLSANRTRYLGLLESAVATGDALQRTGMSEVDLAVQELRNALAPLDPPLAKVRVFATFLGIGEEEGFSAVVGRIFEVATPERIAALPMALISALRDRIRTILEEILRPVRAAITDLKELLALINLDPVIEGIQGVFDEVREQLLAFSPATLLREQLDAFAGLQAELLAFDPLAPILAVLNALRDTAARVIAKLSVTRLLEAPLAIYDTVLDAIDQLNIQTLLAPVLDTLDDIALQVDQGLDETVGAFQRLQESLPPPGGGSSASVSVSVG